MLLAVLLHLLIFHLLTASDAPKATQIIPNPHKDTEYKIKNIKRCPDTGYFFKREPSENALEPYSCNLCFCQGPNIAVCWKRDNRRCDKKSFLYHGVAKKKRDKRSPGFSDIFFRDASRDVFNKNQKTQCKPFESSFSDDCPPADWCTGCTVCDCDANGHWDCHLLSFCPDDKKSKKKHQGPPVPPFWMGFMDKTKEKLINKSSIKKADTRTKIVKKKGPPKNPNKKGKLEEKKKQPPLKNFVKKKGPKKMSKPSKTKKMITPIKYTKLTTKRPNSTKKNIIKKNIATHRPLQIKKSNNLNLENELARRMMKTVMQNLKKTVSAKVKTIAEKARQSAYIAANQKAISKLNQRKVKTKHMHKSQIKKSNEKSPPRKPVPKLPIKKSKAPMKKPISRARGITKTSTRQQYARNKREATVTEPHGISADSNTTDITNTTLEFTVIPMNINQLVPDGGNSSLALMENTIPSNNTYYKYTVVSEQSKIKPDVKIEATTTTKFNKTELIFNLFDEQINETTEKRHIKNNKANKIINTTRVNPEEGEFEFRKWSNVKISKEKSLISESTIKYKSLTKLISHATKTHKDKNKTHDKSVERKLNYRKHNIVKLIQSKCKFKNCNINNNINRPAKTKGDFYDYVTKVLSNRQKNNATKRRKKPGVLKYLKEIFSKIFKGKRAPDKMNKHKLIKTVCDKFGPCSKVKRKDKALLNRKLSELDRETRKIMKTIKIIKGLLKLLELPKTVNNDGSKQDQIHNDVQKLNIILRGNYSENTHGPLTETQKSQIGYIKRNTQDFVKSVSKFASLLNEIIAVLTKEDRFRNKEKNFFMNKNLSKDNPFQSLKNLLLRLNLIQNTFMKQMYEQLNNFENKINEMPEVSEVKDLNNSVAIENISRNIIQNLRKLKHLAQTVSFRGKERGRTKRSTGRDEGAMEYMLMMLEYLIKQNHPLDEPVNDGIDLLIDAIKNAPDIKPIKKKVLDYSPATYSDTTTSTLSTMKIFEDPELLSDDESLSNSVTNENKSSSSENSGITKLEDNESKVNDTKDFVDEITDDEKGRRVESDKMDEITELPFFRELGADENMFRRDPESTSETTNFRTTKMPLEVETVSDKLETGDDFNVEKTVAMENNNLDKFLDYDEVREKKIEVFTGDLDEESYITSTVSTDIITVTDSDIPTTMLTYDPPTDIYQAQKSVTKIIQQKSETPETNSNDKKARLKWIEENFGKDSEIGFVDFEDTNSTFDITPVTTQAFATKTIGKLDENFKTREKVEFNKKVGKSERANKRERANEIAKADERAKAVERKEDDKPQRRNSTGKFSRLDDEIERKKTQAKLSAEEVMFQKQMELLNSLDYGTEKAEVFETESKDSNVDEPNAMDSFPSYYA